MKKTTLFFMCLISISALAEVVQKEVIIGEEARVIFEDLEGQFEHSYGAHVTGLTIDTIVRHDKKIKCTKETAVYGKEDPVVTFECFKL